MRTLNVYLWKEWREQRATLIGLALALPVVVALAACLVPRKSFFADTVVFNGSAALFVLAVSLAVGGELLAGESRGGRLRFLERVPAGLSQAFSAKLLFYLAALLIAGCYGWGVSALAALVRAGTLPAFHLRYALILLPAGAVALWTFAVASWVPRGSVSLPTGLFLMAILGWPFGLCFAFREHYQPQQWELVTAFTLFVLGPLVAARLSFVSGRRFDRPARHAAFLGVGVAALFMFPVWVWTGMRLSAVARIDPLAPGFSMIDARVCGDGRHAAVSAFQGRAWLANPPVHALVVDLESGAWGRAEGHACLEETEPRRGRPSGLGWVRSRTDGTRAYYDPFRDRFFHPEEIVPDERERKGVRVLIGPGPWLLRSSRLSRWFRLDPETGERGELDWPDARRGSHPMLPDGRIFLAQEGSLFLGDPRDGSLTPVAVEGGFGVIVQSAFARYREPMEEARPILLTDFERIYRFDPEALALQPIAVTPQQAWIFAAASTDAVLLVERESPARIVRLDLATGAREVLFPRGNAEPGQPVAR